MVDEWGPETAHRATWLQTDLTSSALSPSPQVQLFLEENVKTRGVAIMVCIHTHIKNVINYERYQPARGHRILALS